mmetsp:Transcript_19478/g.35325  ORF Transcript_19478/g.35325 Transcript_19478/m.35325 type:complete len:207 (-) Transcript_19478:51-671(-)
MGNNCCCNDKASPDVKVVHVTPQLSKSQQDLLNDGPPSIREDVLFEGPPVGEDALLQDAGIPVQPLEKPEAEAAPLAATNPEEEGASDSNVASTANTTEVRKASKVQKGVAPPDISETFEVVIVKPTGCRLGMDLSHRGTHLVVRKIYPDHIVIKHNEAAKAAGTPELREADIVVAINGVKGNDKDMLQVCKDSPTLKFNVSRPAA